MSAPDRSFREVALFDDLDAASFSYAFELIARRKGSEEPRRIALRLGMIADALAADGEKWSEGKPDVFGRLVDPVRSYLDDVTTGPPGTNGRPLIFAASGRAPDDDSRLLTLRRPERWRYEYEGETTELIVPAERREVPMRLRDSFCAFESGRVYYILSLTHPSKGAVPLDEYGVLQLQQLALDPKRAANGAYLSFDWAACGQDGLSLVALANARLKALRECTDPLDVDGIRHVIEPFGLLGPDEEHQPFDPSHLRSLCVGLESQRLLDCAQHAVRRFPPADPQAPPALPDSLADRETQWKIEVAALAGKRPPPHLEPGNDWDRSLLAFAGIAQAVPDFPDQDEAEIHDSTRPSAATGDASLYVHPRFVLEIATDWRSFRLGRPEIGACPYLLLTWLVALHDECIVSDMERRIDAMIYGRAKQPETEAERRIVMRAEPIADLIRLMRSASRLFGQRTRLQEESLRERLELFRWASIHRSGNIFRYAQEKGGLAAVQAAMGTEERFAEAHDALDRYQGLVDNVSSLASSYAERRIGRLLTILSLFGILAFPKMVQEFGQATGIVFDPLLTTAVLAALLAAVFLLSRFGRR